MFRTFCFLAALPLLSAQLRAEDVPVGDQRQDDDLVSFRDQVVPLLTKLGCNTGGCHGKAEGQNGFKLSLFGFEPAEDYEHLVQEGRGRRIFPASPDHSLLLRKPTARVAHEGGKRLDPASSSYDLLRRWIAQGAPRGADAPAVRRIDVVPPKAILKGGERQPLRVLARYADDSTREVTHLSRFDANQPELASVDGNGLVAAKQLPGIAAVMVRYQDHAAVFRATIPLGEPLPTLPDAKNFIDELVFKQLQQLGLPPSEPCEDSTFLRRATIDIAGRLPTPEEMRAFLGDATASKDAALIDRLLASTDYADYFANKWSAVLRNRRGPNSQDMQPTIAFHDWIRASLQSNKPYDRFVREILTATGTESETPIVIWYRELKEASALTEDAAQLFLGQRIQCARCHHHPFEKWSQRDYWSMAAFFSRTEVRLPAPPKKGKKGKKESVPAVPAEVRYSPGSPRMIHPRTGESLQPAGLGGAAIAIDSDSDPRWKLAEWMTAPANPYFARALVNRYWKHFLGRGLVEPEDDLRATNPPANPALLEALARHFVNCGYDMKDLIRTICTSRVYRLSSAPNPRNAGDRQNFSRFYPRRLHAEVLLDAIDDVTLSRTAFQGMPLGTRAVQLPDSQFDSYFLSVFGRPDAASACECERNNNANLAQALHLFNSDELLTKIGGKSATSPATKDGKDKSGKKKKGGEKKENARPMGPSGGRMKQLLADKRPHEERLRDLYVTALTREPSKEELASLLAHLEKKKDNAEEAYADILWAVLNTKEFQYNH